MKSICLAIIICLPIFVKSQFEFSNSIVYYGYGKAFNQLFFIDSSAIFTTDGLEPFYLWNPKNGEVIREVKIPRLGGGFGESAINQNSTQIGVKVSQCHNGNFKEWYTSVIQFYNTKNNTIDNVKFKDLDIVRFSYHPTENNKIAAITFDQDFEAISTILNLETREIETIYFQGKGALMPLYNTFSPDGKQLVIGYGSSSYYGGFSVYDVATKKVIKKVPLKDQPKEFIFLENGNTIIKGLKSTLIYDKNWNEISKHSYQFTAIHPSGKIGLYFDDKNDAIIYNFNTKEKTKLELPSFSKKDSSKITGFFDYSKFSANGTMLAIKFYKPRSDKELNSKTYPSFITFRVTEK